MAKVEENSGETTSSSLIFSNINFTCCTGECPNTVWYLEYPRKARAEYQCDALQNLISATPSLPPHSPFCSF